MALSKGHLNPRFGTCNSSLTSYLSCEMYPNYASLFAWLVHAYLFIHVYCVMLGLVPCA